MNTQQRRRSNSPTGGYPTVGYVYSRRNHRRTSVGSTTSSAGNDLSVHSMHDEVRLCSSCNRLQNELECLRQSTKDALHQSWDEAEILNKKYAEQQDKVAHLNSDLNESLRREKDLQAELNRVQKQLAQCKKKLKKAKSTNGSYLPRKLSDQFLRKASTNESSSQSQMNDNFSASSMRRCVTFAGDLHSSVAADSIGLSSDYLASTGDIASRDHLDVSDHLSSSEHYLSDNTFETEKSHNSSSHFSTFLDMLGLSQHSYRQKIDLNTPKLPPLTVGNHGKDGNSHALMGSHHTLEVSRHSVESDRYDQRGGQEPQELLIESKQQQNDDHYEYPHNICPREFEALKSKLKRREEDIALLENQLVQNTKHFQELLMSVGKE